MKARQLENMGIPRHLSKMAKWLASAARQKEKFKPDELKQRLADIIADPEAYLEDEHFAELAQGLVLELITKRNAENYQPRQEPAPWEQWGEDLDANSIEQMQNACQLPVSVRGALMPDAHLGYGLPIGGVLATENAVIPYAVGVDIACRMKLTVLDMPPKALESQRDRLAKAIETETRFGIGASFDKKRQHDVMDADWNISHTTRGLKDKAWSQLGSSGSGNHFVEFGHFTLDEADLGLEPGVYLALLSHSGSRGPGAGIANHYSRLAMQLHPELPKFLKHLAWLDLDSHAGQEYWAAMELMGEYASANHWCIHHHVVKALGAKAVLQLENHHNFAWKETHKTPDGDDKELIVHRKGATPAGEGVLGIIPGSMATPGYVVRGKGSEASLKSASHGAGRVMSRKKAKQTYRWSHVNDLLRDRGVELLSAGLDEVPQVYKDIDAVMHQQKDLVDIVARFDPKLVKMAPAGERPED